jgi:membrane-associated phospholipid phosphatase
MKAWISDIIGGLCFGIIAGFILFVLPILMESL